VCYTAPIDVQHTFGERVGRLQGIVADRVDEQGNHLGAVGAVVAAVLAEVSKDADVEARRMTMHGIASAFVFISASGYSGPIAAERSRRERFAHRPGVTA